MSHWWFGSELRNVPHAKGEESSEDSQKDLQFKCRVFELVSGSPPPCPFWLLAWLATPCARAC